MSINPKFYLKDSKSDSETLIYLGVRINQQVLFKYSTGCKILPELFDKLTQRPTADRKLIEEYSKISPNIKSSIKVINSTLNKIEDDSNKIIDDLIRLKKEVESKDFKLRLDELYNSHRIKHLNNIKTNFNDYLEQFIVRCESGEKLHLNKKYSKGTIKTYKTFLNTINQFRSRIQFEAIDKKFYNDFVLFLNKKKYSINSVGKNIKFLKVIMKDAYEAGYHENLEYTFKEFRSLSERVDSVYLTEKELDIIYSLSLKDKPNYEVARDIFLIGCYTALRYSDYSRLSHKNIKEKNGYRQIEIITQKTKTPVIIPIKPRVYELMKKYRFELPKTYEQKLNKYIKEICRLAEIVDLVEIQSSIGGELKTSFRPKNELIKTHTARRTGATLLYLAGVPPIDIMKITGHTKESNLLKYICISKEQTAERLAENPFFK